MFKKIIAIVLMAFFITSCAPTDYAQAATISLERAKSLAYTHSRQLTQFRLSTEKAQYQLNQAQKRQSEEYQALNQLNSSYSSLQNQLTSLEDQATAGDTSVTGQIEDIKNQLQSTESKISDQLQAVSSSATIQEAEDTYDDSVAEQQAYKEQLYYAVEKIYTSILTQEDSRAALEEQLRLQEKLLALEEKRCEIGASSRYEVDKMTAEVEALKQTIAESQAAINKTKGELNDYMGRDQDYDFAVTPFSLPASGERTEFDALLKKASQRSLSITQMERDIEQSENEISWINDYYEGQIQSLEFKNKELQLEDLEAQLEQSIANLLSDYDAKKNALKIAVTNYNSALTSYGWEKKRLELGQISQMSLAQSQLSYLQAQNKKNAAEYSLYLAERALELAAEGIL